MKKFLIVLTVVAMASFLLVGCLTTPEEDVVVTTAAIPGVTAPATGATPVAEIAATAQYTGVVTWLPADTTFAAATVYTAKITLTAKTGYTLTGVAVDSFTVAGATATNLADSGEVTAVFPATAADVPVPPVNEAPSITSAAITSGKVGVDYTYTVVATDPDGDDLTYSLTKKPAGMTIATTGVISWTPTAAGSFEVGVKAADPDGLFDAQSFSIAVAAADVPVPPTEAPTIIGVSSDINNDGFVNGSEAVEGVTVTTYAIDGSMVKLYINDELVATTVATRTKANFAIATLDISALDLGEDGPKTLYATAQQPGLDVSDPSAEYTFTLDVVAPEIATATATSLPASTSEVIIVTFDEPVDCTVVSGAGTTIATGLNSALNPDNWEVYYVCRTSELKLVKVSDTAVKITYSVCRNIIDRVEFRTIKALNIADLAGNIRTSDLFVCLIYP